MRINSKNFGLSVAITAAFLWSFYSVGKLCFQIVIISFMHESIYESLSHFGWKNYANKYLAQIMLITMFTGVLGWLVAKIYNDLNEKFSLKLK